jgi:hypothetical protein
MMLCLCGAQRAIPSTCVLTGLERTIACTLGQLDGGKGPDGIIALPGFVGFGSGGSTQGAMGAKLTYYKNLTVTCLSNQPAYCYCQSGSGKNKGSVYSNVCCTTKVGGWAGPRAFHR